MVLKTKKKGKLLLQNSNVGGGEGEGEDKISNLPDALIHHILSFLPTKCGMSTCILSKRWKCVVYSIPVLDFRNWRVSKGRDHDEIKRFMNFLDTFLFRHEKSNIQKFYLDWDRFLDESRVNRWINCIMRRKVEEFGLSIKVLKASSITPLIIFTCDSLTLLDLDLYSITGSKLNIPSTVSFPKLNLLRLAHFSFLDETSSRIFISNCPILEELSLFGCLISRELCIANPALKHLSISFCNIKESAVEIYAPNLLTIRYKGCPPTNLVLDSFRSVVEANVDVYIDEENGNPNKVFVKLFEKLSSAKLLKMCPGLFLVLKEADILLTGLLTFNNLIHLEVTSGYSSTYFGSSDPISTMRAFFRFLQLSPNLESVFLAQSTLFPEKVHGDYGSLDDPKCSLPHLKSIKLTNFHGELLELNVIKLFLNYSGILETVTVVASPWLSRHHKKQLNITKLLLMLPKPADCVVKFLTSYDNA